MGARQSSSNCCYYNDKDISLYVRGQYKKLDYDKIVYPLSKRKKHDLTEFFMTHHSLMIDLSIGLVVDIVPGYFPNEYGTWVKLTPIITDEVIRYKYQ